MIRSAFPTLLLLLCVPALSSADARSETPHDAKAASYYDDRARGWFWREARPLPRPAAPKPRVPASAPGQGGSGQSTPPPLSSEWIRQNLDRLRDVAMDDPTPENVERYMLVQRYAMDKADRFSTAWMDVVRNNPYLDESVDRPLSAAGKTATQTAILDVRRALLKGLAARGVGIWYFYRSDCPYCARQESSLDIIERVHGLSILPISIDGLPPPTTVFADYVVDQGQAESLGVTGTPTLYLNNTQDGRLQRLTVGLRAADEIEDALIHAARTAGWITEDEYVRATQGRAFPLLVDGAPPPPEVAEDPDLLLSYLRATAAPERFTPLAPSRGLNQ